MFIKLLSVLILSVAVVNLASAATKPAATSTPAATAATKKDKDKAATTTPAPTETTKKEKAGKTTTTKGPTTTPPAKAGKYNCGVCTGTGKDCTPTTYDKNVDWCSKITGTVDDPKKVPASFFQLLSFAGLGDIKTMMDKHKGEVVTVRKGAPPAMIALAGQSWNEEGCSNFPVFLGMKNATACLCKGDCVD